MLGQEQARALPSQTPLTLIPSTARLVLLAVVVLLGGCASVADVTGTATQQDLVQIRADLTALQASVRQIKGQLDGLTPQVEGRLREQGVEGDRQSSALIRRLDGLATSVTALTGRVDDINGRLEALSRQARTAAQPATPPGQTPGSAPPPPPGGSATPGVPAPAGPGAPATAAPAPSASSGPRPGAPPPIVGAIPPTAAPAAPPPGARSATGGIQPQDLYQAAYIDFTKGTYTLAITGFREFLRRYPEHQLAANAQYWIGEAHLSQARGYSDGGQNDRAAEELGRAVQEFRKVLANYPRADKAPAALYKEALALIELKQPALAQQRLQYLIENFPQAEETPLARERLAALKDR